MNIYKQIVSHVFDKQSIYKPHIKDDTIIELFTCRFLSYTPKSNIHETYKRFVEFKYFILKNFIFNPNTLECSKMDILDLFCKTQRLHLSLIRFKRILLFKSKRYLDTPLDLNFNDLSETNDNLKINIIHEKIKYLFAISDLIRIINSSLSYEVDFFPEPSVIKNPWNNKPFNISDLYNIYLFIYYSRIPMPILFSRFFYCNFDLKNYELYNQFIIKDYIIENCHNMTDIHKYKYILELIHYYNFNTILSNKQLKIDSTFPKSRLHEIFNPFIKLYLLARYSYEDDIRLINKNRLFAKLKILKKNNDLFGRKFICNHIKKLYYISSIVHNKDEFIFDIPPYIPHPSMICVKSRSFYIDYIPSNNVSYSYFSVFDNKKSSLHKNNVNNTTFITHDNIKLLLSFLNKYTFSERQIKIITDKYLNKVSILTNENPFSRTVINNLDTNPILTHLLNTYIQNGDDISSEDDISSIENNIMYVNDETTNDTTIISDTDTENSNVYNANNNASNIDTNNGLILIVGNGGMNNDNEAEIEHEAELYNNSNMDNISDMGNNSDIYSNNDMDNNSYTNNNSDIESDIESHMDSRIVSDIETDYSFGIDEIDSS